MVEHKKGVFDHFCDQLNDSFGKGFVAEIRFECVVEKGSATSPIDGTGKIIQNTCRLRTRR